MRRALFFLLLLLATATVVWSALNLPPPLWIVKYGLTPGCEPKGKVIRAEGVEFVMIGRGICRIGSDYMAGDPKEDYFRGYRWTRGNVVGRLGGPVGISSGEAPKPSWEMPVHWCEFPEGFGIAKTEVTNAQYERFAPEHGRDDFSKGDSDPVVNVSFEDARKYCEWLSERTGRKVRLPSEAEWEAACRGGTSSEYVSGDDDAGLGEYAWYGDNSEGKAHAVATKSANAWGLYDLSGNVWEWCEDAWHAPYRLTRTTTGPRGETVTETVAVAPTDGSAWEEGGSPGRVIRGGSWYDPAEYCRSGYRDWNDPSIRINTFGFRPALTVPSGR